MFNTFCDHKEAQRQYEERVREAQEFHALQRTMIQQFAQALTWLGKRLVTWSEHLQTRQAIEIQGSESM